MKDGIQPRGVQRCGPGPGPALGVSRWRERTPFSEVAMVHPEAAGRKARGSAMTAPWGQRPCTRLALRCRRRLRFRVQPPPALRPALAELARAAPPSRPPPAVLAPSVARTAPSSPCLLAYLPLSLGHPRDPLFSRVLSSTTVHVGVPREAILSGPGPGLPPERLPEPERSWPQAPPLLWFPAHPPVSELPGNPAAGWRVK